MRSKKGFTLIELLVVISIIALLLSIMMPALQLAKQQAYFIVCRSNLSNVYKAQTLYAQDNDDRIIGIYTWINTLMPYYGFEGDNWWEFQEEFKDPYACKAALKKCPNEENAGHIDTRTFAANRHIVWPEYSGTEITGGYGWIWKITDPEIPAECMFFADAGWTNKIPTSPWWYPNQYFPTIGGDSYTPGFYHFGREFVDLATEWGMESVVSVDRIWLYRDGKENVLYFDGHLDGVTLKEWPLYTFQNEFPNYNQFWYGGMGLRQN